MATYKAIQGYTVQSLASDPSDLTKVTGQLWYNSASNVWKVAIEGSGSWAAKASLNTPRNSSAGFGIPTAAVDVGGNVPYTAAVEEFDGTSWTEVTAYPGVISGAGSLGTLTAGLVFGGSPPSYGVNNQTFAYNGASWTAGGALNASRNTAAGAGTQTAGLGACGGYPAPVGNAVEEYNGVGWTSVTIANNAMRARAGCGSQDSALAIGGYSLPAAAIQDFVEAYNGSSWTEVAVLNRPTTVGGAGGASNTSALFFGGSIPGQTEKTQQFNGTSWTEVGDLGTPRYGPAGLHGQVTTASQLAMAGGFSGSPNYSDACEEWTEPSYVAKTVTTS